MKLVFKKTILLFGLLVILTLLTSCGWTKWGSIHRTNYFVEGEFNGINEKNEDQTFYLKVSSITKEEYNEALGINVVFDQYKKVYFTINLYYKNKDSEETHYITYENLEGYGQPLSYKDDYNNYIVPFISERHHLKDGAQVYNVHINSGLDNDEAAYIVFKNNNLS